MHIYSQCVVLDFDDLPIKKTKQLFKLASQCKHTLISFISVSGCGIKILVRVDSSDKHHREAYKQVMEYYEELLGEKADGATKDIARLCFFSHDKTIFFNETAEVFTVTLPNTESSVEDGVIPTQRETLFKLALDTTNKIKTLIPGERNIYIHTLACNCNRFGIRLEDTLNDIPSQINHGLPQSEVINAINSAYKRNAKEFGIWSSKNKQEKANSEDLAISKIEQCFRNVLSEFFKPLNNL